MRECGSRLPDSECRHLFVYGTLRSSFTNRYARMLASRGTLKGRARMRGRLFDLGDYPGMRLDASDAWVAGELYELRDSEILAELDRYEGTDFRRRAATAVTEAGIEVRAWVYEYATDVSKQRRIRSGDYLKR